MVVLFSHKIKVLLAILGIFFLSGIFVVQAESNKDPFKSELWYLKSIHTPVVVSEVRKESIVAVLDAGFDLNHEDLKNQYWKNTGEIAGDQKDNDHNGYEDDVQGWDFVDNDPDPSPDISQPNTNDVIASHGTILAGIIAAEAQNGKGIVGIAPYAKIMPLRILDAQGRGTTAIVREAIHYAVNNGADVINLSLASTKPDDQLQEVIEWAVNQGVVVVAAIGNDRLDTDRDPTFPACFDTRIGKNRVIGVAALNQKGVKADFSNDGSNCVDISAPGVNIFGAVYHDATNILYSTSYGSPFEGTSLAAPMVTAAVAILRGAYPLLTPDQIRLSLMLSADPLLNVSDEQRKKLGAGQLNIEKALKVAAQFAGEVKNGSSGSIGSQKDNMPSGAIVLAQGAGTEPVVKRFIPNGKELNTFFAYDQKFRGGVRVAVGDVNGDGKEEIVTVPGPGGGPHVRIFDTQGNVLSQFFALDPSDRLGLQVSVGDLNQDGIEEILITQDAGGNGQVRIFTMKGSMTGSFYPFGRTSLPIFSTIGNFDDDTDLEIAFSLGAKDSARRIKIYDRNGRYIRDFAFTKSFTQGVRISTQKQKNKTQDQILVSSVKGGVPDVFVYSAMGDIQKAFSVLPPGFLGGIQVVSADVRGVGVSAYYSVPQSQGGPQVRVFDQQQNVIGGFFAFDTLNRSGLSIAVWSP